MDFDAHSDATLYLVSLIGLALLFLLLLLIAQILWLRISYNACLAREKKFLAIWRPLLMSEISGIPTTCPPLKARDATFFLNLWNHLQESVKGPAQKRLNALAVQTGMAAHAHDLLQKKGLRPRLMALATLGNLQDDTAWNDILALTHSTDRRLSLSAVSALLRINAPRAIQALKPALAERTDWPPAQLAILIQDSGAMDATTLLVDFALALSRSSEPADILKLQRLLQLMVISPSHEKLLAVRTILQTARDSEVITQCLKLLNAPEDLPGIRSHVDHPDWIVRLQAALALGRIGSPEDLPLLQKLLSDPVWDVRHRSADAIVGLVNKDRQRMAGLLDTIEDPFARDMLAMSLAERRMK